MPDCPYALLFDLMAAHDSAMCAGCGLEPQLLEMLHDRHSALAGVHRPDRPTLSDGPAQQPTARWPQIRPRGAWTAEAAHARR